jgi:hypothetical protein
MAYHVQGKGSIWEFVLAFTGGLSWPQTIYSADQFACL